MSSETPQNPLLNTTSDSDGNPLGLPGSAMPAPQVTAVVKVEKLSGGEATGTKFGPTVFQGPATFLTFIIAQRGADWATLSEEELKEAHDTYLEFLLKQCGTIEMKGLPRDVDRDPLPLDEVYVSITTEREVKRLPQERDKEDREKEDERSQRTEKRVEKVELDAAVRDSACAVFLGDPGAGKTTLTRFLAKHFAQAWQSNTDTVRDKENRNYGVARLPVLLRLADHVDALSGSASNSLRAYLPQAFTDTGILPEALRQMFEAAIKAGRLLVIFDGLDEIADEEKRRRMVTAIESFAASLSGGNVVFVTSRTAGYVERPLNSAFQPFTLRELDRLQIENFLYNWCTACERLSASAVETSEISRRVEARRTALLARIDASASLQRLAGNPLLLTILALIHRMHGNLPEHRYELYKQASATLLRDWHKDKPDEKQRIITEGEERDLLAPLAFWMQEQSEAGQVAENDAKELLRQKLARVHKQEPTSLFIEEKLTDFWKRLCETTGLMAEYRHGYYGFIHLTFQEYFAARYLGNHKARRASLVSTRRHHSHWEEVIRLTVSSLSPEEAARLVRTAIMPRGLWNWLRGFRRSALDSYLRRDLLLTARCLSDCASIEPNLAKEVVEDLVAISLNRYGKGAFGPLIERARQTLGALRNGQAGVEAIRLLLLALRDEDSNVRAAAANALGRVGQGSVEVVQELLSALKDDEWSVRSSAIGALGSLSADSVEAQRLLLLALEDEDRNVREGASIALVMSEQSSAEVVQGLLNALKDEDSIVRSSAIGALSLVEDKTMEVVQGLLGAFKDEDWGVRLAASGALGQTGPGSVEVQRLLLQALKDEDSNVREAAANALGMVGQGSVEVVQELFNALKDDAPEVRQWAQLAISIASIDTVQAQPYLLSALKDEDSNVRASAADALGRTGQGSVEVVQGLLNALKDKEQGVRSWASHALGFLSSCSAEAQGLLLLALKDEDRKVRKAAAHALFQTKQGSVEVVQGLLDALKDEDSIVRSSAIGALSLVEDKTMEVVQGLLGAFKDEDWGVRFAVVCALGQVGQASIEAQSQLLLALEDEDSRVRFAAVSALGQTGQNSVQNVLFWLGEFRNSDRAVPSEAFKLLSYRRQVSVQGVQGLFTALKDEEWYVRCWTTYALSNAGVDSKEVLQVLLALLCDEHEKVRIAAIITLGRNAMGSEEVAQTLLLRLKNETVSVRSEVASTLGILGVDSKEVLQALLALLRDKHAEVKNAAWSSLWKLLRR